MLKISSGNARFMKPVNEAISSCRHCQFYRSEGRRGGHCHQLGVPVQGTWKSCSLAMSPFAAGWEKLAGINTWQPLAPEPQVPMEIALQPVAIVDTHPRSNTGSNTAAAVEEAY